VSYLIFGELHRGQSSGEGVRIGLTASVNGPSAVIIDRVFLMAPLTDIRLCSSFVLFGPDGASRLHDGRSGLVTYSAKYCST